MKEFLAFGLKEANACLFAGAFFCLLALSTQFSLGIPRYDFIFLAALALQLILILSKLETPREFLALCLFHLLGLALEIFKTDPRIGSWSYPGPGRFKLAGVPLYSGFMYASVASYMIRAWRLLKLRLSQPPSRALSAFLALSIYLNFFSHHFLPDFRWLLMALVLLLFRKTRVHFSPLDRERSMPLALSFALIGFFIWLAENMATLLGAWAYPQQRQAWAAVHTGKIGSWALLAIVSFIIVAGLKEAEALLDARGGLARVLRGGHGPS